MTFTTTYIEILYLMFLFVTIRGPISFTLQIMDQVHVFSKCIFIKAQIIIER